MIIRTSKYILTAIIFFSLVLSCTEERKVLIALSKGIGSEHYSNYSKWMESYGENIECLNLYGLSLDSAKKVLHLCNGFVLTGGPDVHPGRYGKEWDTARCEIDLIRDTLEYAMIEEALRINIPILAICRGEQILNTAMGGTLIVDIPEDFDTAITHRCPDPTDCYHEVDIVEGTFLSELSKISVGTVNTNHHQAVGMISSNFKISARSKDGLIEAYEWKDRKGKPFLIAVQWHPERMAKDSPLSYPIGKKFIEESKRFYPYYEKSKL